MDVITAHTCSAMSLAMRAAATSTAAIAAEVAGIPAANGPIISPGGGMGGGMGTLERGRGRRGVGEALGSGRGAIRR